MEFINTWLQGIIISVIIATIIEMILPSGNNKKYIKIVLGIYIVFNIMTPVINKITNNEFEISSIINIEEYTKKMKEYEIDTSSSNIDEINNNSIEQIYINNLKKDIKSKLEEKEYIVNNIEIKLNKNEEYKIEKLVLYIENKEKEEKNEERKDEKLEDTENYIQINKIEQVDKVDVNITDSREKINVDSENQMTEKQKQEIRDYIVSVYEIKEIVIY